jgi:GH35 family endo-1,4-beta-xylanase
MVEPEDALKWWTIRPTAESFDFKQGDQNYVLLRRME